MMDNKKNLGKKIAAGAMLVALSGFVPKVTTINATGSFTTGIKMTAGNDLQFGVIVPTGASGSVVVTTAGASTPNLAFNNGGIVQPGSIKFSAGASKVVDITVTGLKNSLTLGGATTAGTVNLPTVVIGGPLATAQTFKIATSKQTNTLNSVTKDLQIGGTVTWNAVSPVGTFNTPIKVIVSF